MVEDIIDIISDKCENMMEQIDDVIYEHATRISNECPDIEFDDIHDALYEILKQSIGG